MDLLGVHLTERATEDREVLGEKEHLAAVDRPPSRHDPVGERTVVLDAEAMGAVARQHVEFDERAGIEQQVDALACRELAALVLTLDGRVAPCVQRLFLELRKLLEPFGQRMCGRDRPAGRVFGHAGRLLRASPLLAGRRSGSGGPHAGVAPYESYWRPAFSAASRVVVY